MKKSVWMLVSYVVFTVSLIFLFTACPGTGSSPVNSDAEAVAAAKTTLAVLYASGDTAEKVRGNVTLPITSGTGVSVSWESSVPEVVADTGVVTRPQDINKPVTLTATLTKGSESDTKVFIFTVYGINQEKVDNVKEVLSVPAFILSSETEILFPQSSEGVAITWISNSPGIIGSPLNGTATVTTPSVTTTVEVIATISVSGGTAQAVKSFPVIVYAAGDEPSAEEYIAAAKNALIISYAEGDSASSVTKDITLPVSGGNGVSISWSVASGKEEWCSSAGVIKRDLVDIPVQLTATLSKSGGSSVTKTFDITVSRVETITLDEGASSTEYSFISNVLTISKKNGPSLSSGAKYTYTVDITTKKVTLEQTHLYADAVTDWISKADWITEYKSENISMITAFKEMSAKTSVTLSEIIAWFRTNNGSALTEDQIISYILYYDIGVETAEEFKNLDAVDLAAKMNIFCLANLKDFFKTLYGISINTIDDAFSFVNENAEKAGEAEFLSAQFEYELQFDVNGTCNNISLYSIYDDYSPWYKQYGLYKNNAGVWLEAKLDGSGFLGFSLSSSESVTFNSNFTTVIDSSDNIWNISSDVSKKSITISNGSGSYELFFEGYFL